MFVLFVLFSCVFFDDLSQEFQHAHARACKACMHTRTHAHVHTCAHTVFMAPEGASFCVHLQCCACACTVHVRMLRCTCTPCDTCTWAESARTHTCIHYTSHPSPATHRLNTAAKGPARKSSGPRKQQIRVTEEVAAKLKAKAAGANVPVSDIVEDILMTALTK